MWNYSEIANFLCYQALMKLHISYNIDEVVSPLYRQQI